MSSRVDGRLHEATYYGSDQLEHSSVDPGLLCNVQTRDAAEGAVQLGYLLHQLELVHDLLWLGRLQRPVVGSQTVQLQTRVLVGPRGRWQQGY